MSRWLSHHPDVVVGRRKEPMYHAHDLASSLNFTDEENYLDLWAGASDEAYRVDASPWYLFSKEAAASVARMRPDARFIVHLRDPVDLIGSLHAHHVFTGFEKNKDLESAVFTVRRRDEHEFRNSIDYLEVVRVASQLQRYFDHFPENRVSYVDFSSVRVDPDHVYSGLLHDLGLAPIRLDSYEHLNRARHTRLPIPHRLLGRDPSMTARRIRKAVSKFNVVPGRPEIEKRVRGRILEVIRPEIDDLEQMTGKDLSAWKR